MSTNKIACLGGGNAMPRAVLEGLKHEDVEIFAICAMLDSGGSSGRLREDYGIVSPGDIRRAFIALANTSPIIEELFDYRFQAGELQGHNFANLFITALNLSTNDGEKTFETMNDLLNVSHQVLPVTLDSSHVCAVLEDGQIIEGETNIDIPKHDGSLKIEDVFLRPKAKAYPKAINAVYEADKIVLGPGDLFSSLAQILLVEGMAEAIRNSEAQKIYITNLMTKNGETNEFTVSDFTKKAEQFLGGEFDKVIYNNNFPNKKRVEKYKESHEELIELVKPDNNLDENKFVGADVLVDEGKIIHDSDKLTNVILNL
ncbi:MAG: gluconeogenesis factor YvcK family protein [Patescibacteria group bacterium]